jgi:hypothetical protein
MDGLMWLQWSGPLLRHAVPPIRCADSAVFNHLLLGQKAQGGEVHGSHGEPFGGDDGDRTHDLRLAKPALYQLSYIPLGISILPNCGYSGL